MDFKKVKLGALAASLLLSLAGPAGSAMAEESVKLGANYELTGAAASYGTPMSKGTELAVKQRNADGGVLGGQEVELVTYDNKSDLTETSSVATRLVEEGVFAIVGPAPSGDVLSQAAVINKAGVPAVSPAGTVDDLTKDNNGNLMEYLFRVCFEDRYQGKAGAKYVAEELGAKKAALVVDQGTDYAQGMSKAFEEEFKAKGGEIVANESYNSGDTDFSAVLTSLMAQDFDVLFVPGYYTEVGLLIKQAREMGITQPIVGGDGYHSQTLVELAEPQNASDIYYTTHFSPESEDPKVQQFLKDYKEEFGEEADTFAALAYDATNLIFDAVERAGSTDRDAVRQALSETKGFEGITGTFDMGEDNTPIKSALMLKLNNGEVESTQEVTAE
ncbi:ABC transporter substrate-binding protein [Hutsoniella sourekii]